MRTTKRSAVLLTVCLLASTAHAARITVGTVASSYGAATVPLTFASEGAAIATVRLDLSFAPPLSYVDSAIGFYASGAGKELAAVPISGGVRLTISGTSPTAIPDGTVATVTFAVASSAPAGSYPVAALNALAADTSGMPAAITPVSGAVTVGSSQPAAATWIIPSSAHVAGAGGTMWTTDLVVANTGAANGTFTMKFLGHDADGRGGPQVTLAIDAGKTTVVGDVLGTQFDQTSGYGAIQVSSTVTTLAVSAQTSTPSPTGGTFGQAVPAVASAQLVSKGSPRSIVGIREDGSFRTNLVLANAGQAACDVDVTLVQANGASAGTKRYSLPPLGMKQVPYVAREFVSTDVSGARVVIAPVTSGGTIAAYASVIDGTTGDPRTLLPQ